MPVSKSYLKALPLDVTKLIVDYLNLDRVLIKHANEPNTLVKLVEASPNPQYYFIIREVVPSKSNANKSVLKLEYKPRHKDNPDSNLIDVVVDTVPKVFNDWFKLIEEYDQTLNKIQDIDPDTQRLLDEFKIDVTDQHDEYFSPDEQAKVDQLLDSTIKELSKYSGSRETEQKLSSVKDELIEMREKQATLTKGSFRKSFARALTTIKEESYPTFMKIGKFIVEEVFRVVINIGVGKF